MYPCITVQSVDNYNLTKIKSLISFCKGSKFFPCSPSTRNAKQEELLMVIKKCIDKHHEMIQEDIEDIIVESYFVLDLEKRRSLLDYCIRQKDKLHLMFWYKMRTKKYSTREQQILLNIISNMEHYSHEIVVEFFVKCPHPELWRMALEVIEKNISSCLDDIEQHHKNLRGKKRTELIAVLQKTFQNSMQKKEIQHLIFLLLGTNNHPQTGPIISVRFFYYIPLFIIYSTPLHNKQYKKYLNNKGIQNSWIINLCFVFFHLYDLSATISLIKQKHLL